MPKPPPVMLRSLLAALLVAIGILLQIASLRHVGVHHPFLVFYPAVAIAALFLGFAGGLTATILAVLAVCYYWMPPPGIWVEGLDDQIYVAVFLLEGLLITYAAEWARRGKVAEAQARMAEERRTTAERLQESEQRLRLALESGKMGMWSWEVGSNLAEFNEREYELLGLPKGEGVESADVFFDMVHPDDLPEMKRILDAAAKGEMDYVHEFRIVRPDGEVRWLAGQGRLCHDPNGKPPRVRGVNYDITSRKLAEEELRRSEAEARARADELAVLMDTVPAITFMSHDTEGLNMSGSRQSRLFLRIPEGKSVSVSAPEGERPHSFRIYQDGKELAPEELPVQRAARGEVIRNCELTVVFNDGRSAEICGDAVPLFDDAGDVRGAIGAFLDITQRKKMERELQEAHDELEKRVEERTAELRQAMESLKRETEERVQAVEALREKDQLLIHQSRLAAMGEMISNIAHQWRQPLNIMSLVMQELPVVYARGGFSEEYLKGQVAKARDLIAHMSQTIEDFRNFFRPSRERLVFRVREVIAKTLPLVDDTFRTLGITLEYQESGEPAIYGYVSECCQVLLNVLLNARDAFLVSPDEKPRKIKVTAFSENGRTVVTIADNAGGIPEEIMGKIFDPYFTTKGPDQGTGIGLFMSRTIIEKHMNGRFTARNVDDGAEFRIEVDPEPHL